MKPFSLLVKPASADCNLRCKYCFYLDRCELYPESRRHRMSDAVLERMISSFMATPQPQYAFGWQGGEPTLMGLDFFKRVVELQQKHGRQGAVVSNGLQTNGTMLTDEFAQHLAKYHFLVGVSVDGPAAIHDKSRLTVDERGSHAMVMKGIEHLKRHTVDYNILTLVSSANVKHPKEIYHYLLEQGVLFHQYIECVEFDEQGRRMPFAISDHQWGDFLCGIYDEWIKGDTHRVSVRLFDSILTRMVEGVANVCHIGTDCRQYLVVEHNGDIYPCDFYVRPELKLGNIMTGEWAQYQQSPLYAEFGCRKHQWNDVCTGCEYLEFCGGDCQKNRWGGGADPRTISSLCEGWKQFYQHALPGLRTLAAEVRSRRMLEDEARRRQMTQIHSSTIPGAPKAGRNDPCPCGSGKKYKKCCG